MKTNTPDFTITISKNDQALIDNLKYLAEKHNNGRIAINLRHITGVTIVTSYWHLYLIAKSVLENKDSVVNGRDVDTLPAQIKPIAYQLRNRFKNEGGIIFDFPAAVAVSFSREDILHSFRFALSGDETLWQLEDAGSSPA
ncbi:hypothetical protein MLL21_07815 [Escherichia coli]|nr:hypothetical protein [Escherichia coli]